MTVPAGRLPGIPRGGERAIRNLRGFASWQSARSRHPVIDKPVAQSFLPVMRIPPFLLAVGLILPLSIQAQEAPAPAPKPVPVPVPASAPSALPVWIWVENATVQTAHFRKEFQVPADVTQAILVSAAEATYQVYVNGTRVGRGKGATGLNIDLITAELKPGGKNSIAVRVEEAKDKTQFVARLVLTAKAGETVIVTDDTWKATARAEKGWQGLDFVPPAQNTWAAATKRADVVAAGDAPVTLEKLVKIEIQVPQATPVDLIKVKEGFKVELLYSVPKEKEGSWVAMTVDSKGRFIVSDQYGFLYRLPAPAPGKVIEEGQVEKIEVDLGGAQGLLWAHESLYVVLNTNEHGGRGLYRVKDTNGDDKLDKVELLKKFEENGGEHGPHAVLLGPDKTSIYVVCGNQTALPDGITSRVPPVWDEDQILPRIYGRGFMKGVLAPRGWIAKTDPDGKNWEILCTGFRNEYDAGFNRDGELFSYDADMEWDMNLPWYRPTRVNHVISGAEFGWRNGSAKWPDYYSDSFGAVVNIGPGSPTGTVFGYGAKFPAKYQDAFFICDWSYGKLYAVHMTPDGASYTATFEEFIAAQPLPLTDLVVHPDGALYFAIGGRKVQSGLYRVTYTGQESTEPSKGIPGGEKERALRHSLEKWHVGAPSPAAITEAWPHLASQDRAIRYAARTAIEHQPVERWIGMAVSESDPQARLAALIALARAGKGQPNILDTLIASLGTLDYAKLTHQQRLDLIRAYSLTVVRHGGGYPNTLTPDQTKRILAHLDPVFPAKTPEENIELSQLMANLNSPTLPKKAMELLAGAPSQEEQIAYAKNVRLTTTGWNLDLRKQYFTWLVRALTYKGGASFDLFIQDIRNDAIASLSEDDKVALKPLIDAKPESAAPQFAAKVREFVKNYTVADFNDVIHVGLEGNRDFTNGRNVFGTVGCFACHRFKQEGGAIGPDLTSVAGKFGPNDLLESIIDPNKEISDQYGAMMFEMNDGSMVIGRVMNLNGDNIMVNVNMYDPNQIVGVDRKQLKGMKPSPVSMMPPGLVNVLSKDDVLDLLAYLLSKGNPDDPMFK